MLETQLSYIHVYIVYYYYREKPEIGHGSLFPVTIEIARISIFILGTTWLHTFSDITDKIRIVESSGINPV